MSPQSTHFKKHIVATLDAPSKGCPSASLFPAPGTAALSVFTDAIEPAILFFAVHVERIKPDRILLLLFSVPSASSVNSV